MGGSKDMLKLRILLVILLVTVLFVTLHVSNYFQLTIILHTSLSDNKTVLSPQRKPKLILFYTSLWGNRLWPGFETTQKFNNWGGVPCAEQNCRVTYNKKMIDKADVVVFHAFGSDMPSQRHLLKLSKRRNPNSYWIYFIHECPHNALPQPILYDNLFNWTMGYRYDADITVPYNWEWGHWERLQQPKVRTRNHAEGKDKLVFAGISHCGCMRELYIKKLMSYINVDVYGQCSGRLHDTPKPPCQRGSAECTKLLDRYKFFLAFENSFCKDYASEKFTETILEGKHVPIVMGGADYKKIGLPNSFIDVNDFPTIEDLANYIKYLDDNDEAYNKHFEHQQLYKLGKPRSWSCTICQMINNEDLKPSTYTRLGDWYSVQNQCGTKLKVLQEIMHKSGAPRPYIDEYYKYEYDFD